MGDDIVKKKMIVLIAFIYIASMLFCGDGVGKKLVEEKFPHLTYSDKECDDSKKKELRIVEDEDTAGGILSYEELAAMENENASVRNNMLPDTDQLAFVDEAEKKGELAELEEQQNVKMPQVDWITTTVTRSVSSHTLYYTVTPNETSAGRYEL